MDIPKGAAEQGTTPITDQRFAICSIKLMISDGLPAAQGWREESGTGKAEASGNKTGEARR